jgi:hypothetical protein
LISQLGGPNQNLSTNKRRRRRNARPLGRRTGVWYRVGPGARRAPARLSAAPGRGILAWLVEGCLDWQNSGLGSCDAVDRATTGYRTENDTIGRFVAECCDLGDDHRVQRKALRAALTRYCEATRTSAAASAHTVFEHGESGTETRWLLFLDDGPSVQGPT